MFLKGMLLPVVITAALGACLKCGIRENNKEYILSREREITDGYLRMRANSQATNQPPGREPFIVMLSSYIESDASAAFYNPVVWVEPNIKTSVVTFDADGNFVTTSRRKMTACIRYSEDDRRWYTYDPLDVDIPELHQLFALGDNSEQIYTIELKSVYVNDDTMQMVPHVIDVSLYDIQHQFLGYFYETEDPVETYQVTVGYEPEGYTLLEICDDDETDDDGNFVNYPRASFEGIWGTAPADFDSMVSAMQTEIGYALRAGYDTGDCGNSSTHGQMYCYQTVLLPFDEELAGVSVHVEADYTGFAVWRRLYFVLGVLFCLMTLFVLVRCIIRNTKNKAQYAFEDYQRALTNNLAHDLKTPLAVIGGYAENLIQMRQGSENAQELEYLHSIMKNVSYTDDIISKTLKLSETEQIKKPHKTEIDVKRLTEQLAEKYRPALAERGITLNIEGSGTVTADADLLTDTVENLLSNAVKYTRDDGRIAVTADKKHLCIVNDTASDVDTKDLTMPFVKGDKARGDKRSSGLGLAIAAAAAEQNGFSLKLSSSDRKFKAELEF